MNDLICATHAHDNYDGFCYADTDSFMERAELGNTVEDQSHI